MKQLQLDRMLILSFYANGYKRKDIADRLNVSYDIVCNLISNRTKGTNSFTKEKINKSVIEIKKSKSKSNKALKKYLDYTIEFLLTSKNSKQLFSRVHKLHKSESIAKTIVKEKIKLDKRRTEGGDWYKQELIIFYEQINKGDIILEVI